MARLIGTAAIWVIRRCSRSSTNAMRANCRGPDQPGLSPECSAIGPGHPEAVKELRSLAFLWEIIHYENLERARFRDVHVHAIYDEKTMLKLGVSSKLNTETSTEFLTGGKQVGFSKRQWRARCRQSIS